MRACLALKYHPDRRNRGLVALLSDALASQGCGAYCVARDLENWGGFSFSPAELMRRSFTAIDACDFVLVELSEKGVGVGVEAGYVYAKGKVILTLAKEGCDISDTLRGISNQATTYTPATLPGLLARALPALPLKPAD